MIDRLVSKLSADSMNLPDLATWSGRWKGRSLHLLQPLAFMNRSGPPIQGYLRKIGASLVDLLIIVDDLDLPPGTLRIRPGGSAGGHRGLEDLIDHLGTDRFARCRLGIGRPDDGEAVEEFVLMQPPEEPQGIFHEMKDRAAEAALCWSVEGVKNAALRYNGPLPGGTAEDSIPEN